MFYWVVGLVDGRTVLLGPYNTEDRANEVAMTKFTDDFEVVELPYKDEVRVTKIIKARKLKNSTLQEALERVRHKFSVVGEKDLKPRTVDLEPRKVDL